MSKGTKQLKDKKMENLEFKTIGAAGSETVIFNAKKLADWIEDELNDRKSTDLQALQLTQEFVNNYKICARYASGTFIGFKVSEEAEEEFSTFKRK